MDSLRGATLAFLPTARHFNPTFSSPAWFNAAGLIHTLHQFDRDCETLRVAAAQSKVRRHGNQL